MAENPNMQLSENMLIRLAEKIAEMRMRTELEGGEPCPAQIVVEYLRRGGLSGERKAAIDSAQAEMLAKKAASLKSTTDGDAAIAALEAYMRYTGANRNE